MEVGVVPTPRGERAIVEVGHGEVDLDPIGPDLISDDASEREGERFVGGVLIDEPGTDGGTIDDRPGLIASDPMDRGVVRVVLDEGVVGALECEPGVSDPVGPRGA